MLLPRKDPRSRKSLPAPLRNPRERQCGGERKAGAPSAEETRAVRKGKGKARDKGCALGEGNINGQVLKDPRPGLTPRWQMFSEALVTETLVVACPHCPGKLCSSREPQTVP